MIQYFWSDPFAFNVFADCLGQQSGNILMALSRQGLEFVPDGLVDL
jgi:hypothetical protein